MFWIKHFLMVSQWEPCCYMDSSPLVTVVYINFIQFIRKLLPAYNFVRYTTHYATVARASCAIDNFALDGISSGSPDDNKLIAYFTWHNFIIQNFRTITTSNVQKHLIQTQNKKYQPVVKAGVHSCSPVAPHNKARLLALFIGVGPNVVPRMLRAPDALIMRLRLGMLPWKFDLFIFC